MQVVPLIGKADLVAHVVCASCATCATTKYCAQQAQNLPSLVAATHSYLLDFFALKRGSTTY